MPNGTSPNANPYPPKTTPPQTAAAPAIRPFGTAMAGAWVGEKIQGDTTDKMRERGELPPTG